MDIRTMAPSDTRVTERLSRVRFVHPESDIILKCRAARPGLASECGSLGIAGCLPETLSIEAAIAVLRLVLCHVSYYPCETAQHTRPERPIFVTERPRAVAFDLAHACPTPPHSLERLMSRSGASGGMRQTPNTSSRSGTDVFLTRRERDVVECVCQGKSNKIIAYELGMSLSTVKVHLRNVMRKMKVTNRMQVALQVPATFGPVDRQNFGSFALR
ncbi:helix-turn-helix domain-containing protein [Pararhizobium mangrovi]|nr:response regulator transcription factor [Pararhizobium mangrovi]